MASSPFEEVNLKVCVSLLPSDIGDVYGGIRRNIYQFLMRYNEAVGGVLLAVSDLSFRDGSGEGRINDEMPHIHFDVKGKAQVFRPRPGHVLEGRVNKVTSTHIGMLVCGIFNTAVASEAMGKGFAFDAIAREWRGPGGQVIAVGDDAKFVVTGMHEAAGLISMEGSLEGMGRIEGEADHRDAPDSQVKQEIPSAGKSAKKKSKKDKARKAQNAL